MEIIPEAFSPLYPQAFIRVINSLDSPDNMLTNNVLYPRGTSVGKDKHGLSIGSAKVKHERNAIMQHAPAMCQSSNYIWSSFLSNLLWMNVPFVMITCNVAVMKTRFTGVEYFTTKDVTLTISTVTNEVCFRQEETVS